MQKGYLWHLNAYFPSVISNYDFYTKREFVLSSKKDERCFAIKKSALFLYCTQLALSLQNYCENRLRTLSVKINFHSLVDTIFAQHKRSKNKKLQYDYCRPIKRYQGKNRSA